LPPPHRSTSISNQAHIAEFAQVVGDGFVGSFAACEAVADGFVGMTVDFDIEFFFVLLPTKPMEFHASHSCFG